MSIISLEKRYNLAGVARVRLDAAEGITGYNATRAEEARTAIFNQVTRSQIECKSSICGRFLFGLIQKNNIQGKVLLTITTITTKDHATVIFRTNIFV